MAVNGNGTVGQNVIQTTRGFSGNQLAKTSSSVSSTLREMLNKQKDQIAMVLPKHMTPERLCRIAMTAIQSTPKLMECEPISIVRAVMQSAQLGLELDNVLGHCYLVPYGKQAQFQIGYRGLIKLAYDSIKAVIHAEVVFENDEFIDERGTSPKLIHRPNRTEERKVLVAAYAVATLPGGSSTYAVLYKPDIDRIRKSSKTAGTAGSPWQSHETEMWKKTAARQLCKYLPLSANAIKAVVRDEYQEEGIEMNEDDILDVNAVSTPTTNVSTPQTGPSETEKALQGEEAETEDSPQAEEPEQPKTNTKTTTATKPAMSSQTSGALNIF